MKQTMKNTYIKRHLAMHILGNEFLLIISKGESFAVVLWLSCIFDKVFYFINKPNGIRLSVFPPTWIYNDFPLEVLYMLYVYMKLLRFSI